MEIKRDPIPHLTYIIRHNGIYVHTKPALPSQFVSRVKATFMELRHRHGVPPEDIKQIRSAFSLFIKDMRERIEELKAFERHIKHGTELRKGKLGRPSTSNAEEKKARLAAHREANREALRAKAKQYRDKKKAKRQPAIPKS